MPGSRPMRATRPRKPSSRNVAAALPPGQAAADDHDRGSVQLVHAPDCPPEPTPCRVFSYRLGCWMLRNPSEVKVVRQLEGRGAVVTGAGRGIGRAAAAALAKEGADVALVARSSPQLAEAAGDVGAVGG